MLIQCLHEGFESAIGGLSEEYSTVERLASNINSGIINMQVLNKKGCNHLGKEFRYRRAEERRGEARKDEA